MCRNDFCKTSRQKNKNFKLIIDGQRKKGKSEKLEYKYKENYVKGPFTRRLENYGV